MATDSQRVALNTAVQVIGRFVVSGLGAVSVAVTTRYLGLNGYGQLTTAIIFVSLFATLTDSGISNIGIREIARGERKKSEVIGSVTMLRTIMASVAAGLCIGLTFLIYHSPNDAPIRQAAIFLALLLIPSSIQTALTAGLAARLRNDLIVIGDVAGKALTIGLILYAVKHNLGFTGILWATAIGGILNFIFDLFFGLRDCIPSFRIDRIYLRYIIMITLPLAAAAILNTLYYRADGFLLSLFKTSADVGLYGVAYKIVELTMYIPIVFMGSVFPLLAAAHKDTGRMWDITSRSLKILSLVGMAAVVGVIILSPELSRLLGGKEFAAAALPMSLLMVGNYFVYLNSAYANALLATDHQNILLRITMYNLAINLALNLVLIPLYGTAGAAASVAVTEATQLIYLRFHFRKLISSKHFQLKLPLLVIAAAAMALTVWFVKTDLAARGLLIALSGSVLSGAVVYLGLVLLLKIVTLNEVKEIMRFKRA